MSNAKIQITKTNLTKEVVIVNKKDFKKILFPIGLILFFTLYISNTAYSQEKITKLKNVIENIIKPVKGEIGVAIKHLESGEELYINGDEFFPMASVFKIPILIEVMAQVREGKMSLEDEYSVRPFDQHLGSGILSDLKAPGIKLSLENLINLMMIISDNSATDILLSKVGIEQINQRLRQYGIKNIIISRSCQHLILNYLGLDYEKYKDLSPQEFYEFYRREKEKNPRIFEEAREKFSLEMKDVATPRAMNTLLEKIFRHEILDEESCNFIISIMLKCQTGERRIKGKLPSGTKVAHKTGTIGGTINDSGIIYLPDNLGHIAITIFSKNTKDGVKSIEDIIAEIAEAAYFYFYFTL
jgi:beta-lactamase class A